jgi:hypothetical protein
MKFDPDKAHLKHRDANGGAWYVQNGHRYSMAGVDLGKIGSTEKPPKTKKDKDVRKRAAKKLKDFSGEGESFGPVADALRENKAAAAAEEQAGE